MHAAAGIAGAAVLNNTVDDSGPAVVDADTAARSAGQAGIAVPDGESTDHGQARLTVLKVEAASGALTIDDGELRPGDADQYDISAAKAEIPVVCAGIGAGIDAHVSAHLDLHGKTRTEARALVEQFIGTARTDGKRCVLIVHGRGLHSKDHIPVLKEALALWLTRGRISRSVLAFCTARPCDGGLGAVYVLLRK